MEHLQFLGMLFLAPWVILAIVAVSVLITVIVMAPVQLAFLLCCYRGNWREMMYMEGWSDRRPEPQPVKLRLIQGRRR